MAPWIQRTIVRSMLLLPVAVIGCYNDIKDNFEPSSQTTSNQPAQVQQAPSYEADAANNFQHCTTRPLWDTSTTPSTYLGCQ